MNPRKLYPVPPLRIRAANRQPSRPDGQYVLYWMTAQRRSQWNFALQHAVHRATEWNRPLVVFEPLRARYQWASDRMHRFVIEGMRDNAQAFANTPVTYFPYVEPEGGVATPLLHLLAAEACVVVSDDYPCFFLPQLVRTVADRLPVALELVDSNSVIPMRAADRTFTVAHSYRRWMQKVVADYLSDPPLADPIRDARFPRLSGLPSRITQRWPAADLKRLLTPEGLRDLPIDHHVKPGPLAGGRIAALGRLDEFLRRRLSRYDEDRNQPDVEGSTGLSPYLHFGQISAHEIVSRILDAEDWDPSRLGRPLGKNHGFWGTQPSAEALLDQLLTWRELGFNMCSRESNYDRYESLPNWARQSLAKHARDPRERVYTLEQFAAAETHDQLWNAAQRQLNRDGVMHNYLRMLWGKKILEWTRSPEQALEIMIELNNRYALDGRDPNSYSGIFWVLGRYDRAWGPERPIFGLIRYMSSENTQRKVRVRQYLERYGADADSRLFPR